MNIVIPPMVEVRAELAGLAHARMQELAKLSGVPFTTLWKIKDGTTENPGIETVRKFWPYLSVVRREVA